MLSTELFLKVIPRSSFNFFFHLIPFLTCEALLIIFSAFTSNGLKTTTTSKRNIPYSNKKWNYMGFCSQAQKVQVCHVIPIQSLRVEGLPINFQLLLFVVRWSMAMQISRNKRIFTWEKSSIITAFYWLVCVAGVESGRGLRGRGVPKIHPHGYHFIVLYTNMAAMASYENDLLSWCNACQFHTWYKIIADIQRVQHDQVTKRR